MAFIMSFNRFEWCYWVLLGFDQPDFFLNELWVYWVVLGFYWEITGC